MPFEIAPQVVEAPAKFADVADVILRGCALTKPTLDGSCSRRAGNVVTHACIWMAYHVGMDGAETQADKEWPDFRNARMAYLKKYQVHPVEDYTEGRFTREQIAERIRAL